MDPTTTCCPKVACPARGHTGQGTSGLHACQGQRCIGPECPQTGSATHGTACSRLRTFAETVRLVGTLRAHGWPRHAIVVACGYDERTVACWLARATFRARLGSLTRRRRALARRTLTVPHGMSRIGTGENLCTPQARLRCAGGATTPAMAAGITAHGWTVRALRLLPVPPPRWTPPKQRGRPSRALKRLLERWCS